MFLLLREDTMKGLLDTYESTTLEALGNALLSREEFKFVLHQSALIDILQQVRPHYQVLEVNGKRIHHYTTTYYDQDNQMYLDHHNGRANRYKIRVRGYENGTHFLEVKEKTNKGKTVKKRYPTSLAAPFRNGEAEHVAKHSPYNVNKLAHTLNNAYDRITLMSNDPLEKCTIDFNLEYTVDGQHIHMDDLVIIEIKQPKLTVNSPLYKALKAAGIYPTPMSKYCTGRALADHSLKQNRFKPLLGRIKTITKSTH